MQLRNLRHDRDAATALLRRAVELGVNHAETAQFYGDGLVDDLIRAAVGSKVGADPDPGGHHPIRMAQRTGQLAENLAAGALTIDTATLVALDAIPSHANA
jgi:pyridoxine 4-dehydrogenase